MKAPATELDIDLGGDRLAVVTITVIASGLPSPLERDEVREPTVHEIDQIAAAITRRAWNRKP